MDVSHEHTPDELRMIDHIRIDFKCQIDCLKVREINPKNEETEFGIGRRKFRVKISPDLPDGIVVSRAGYRDLDCSEILLFEKDENGNKVIKLYKELPCFDSGDRMFDSMHSLKFFYGGKRIHALYCEEGYYIAELYLFEDIVPISDNIKALLKDHGFPVQDNK